VADDIHAVTRLLVARPDGLPGLLVDSRCVCTIAEYGMYRYPAVPAGTVVKRDSCDEPVQLADHAMDATRYALHSELGEAAKTEAYLAEMQRRLVGCTWSEQPLEHSKCCIAPIGPWTQESAMERTLASPTMHTMALTT
jgi:hypothetical protein